MSSQKTTSSLGVTISHFLHFNRLEALPTYIKPAWEHNSNIFAALPDRFLRSDWSAADSLRLRFFPDLKGGLVWAVWPDLTNYRHVGTNFKQAFATLFHGSFSIWQNLKPTLPIFCGFLAKLQTFKWPNIAQIISPSGHTVVGEKYFAQIFRLKCGRFFCNKKVRSLTSFCVSAESLSATSSNYINRPRRLYRPHLYYYLIKQWQSWKQKVILQRNLKSFQNFTARQIFSI